MIKPFIFLKGNCEEALKTYKKAFDGKITNLTRYKDLEDNSPVPVTKDNENKILVVELAIGEDSILLSDDLNSNLVGTNIALFINLKTTKEAKKAWDILKENVTITMDLAKSQFAELDGWLVDQYGTSWNITVMDEMP
ncbi:MAG: VOC family protein [Methanobrevibacter sp.]|nr:VOC family protein [Methanobrevibacter sp.]